MVFIITVGGKKGIENAMRFSVHPKFDKLENDFNQFFSDIDFYTVMVSQVYVKVLFTGPEEQSKTTIAKALRAKCIRISMFCFMPMITLKMFATPLLRRKYPLLL